MRAIWRRLSHLALVVALVCAGLCVSRSAAAYSVLAHEANIDALWDTRSEALLLARFPRVDREELAEARAYAYGGCVIQDLGYYPFGSHFFSNLLHYVRTGDFVEALIRDARTSTSMPSPSARSGTTRRTTAAIPWRSTVRCR